MMAFVRWMHKVGILVTVVYLYTITNTIIQYFSTSLSSLEIEAQSSVFYKGLERYNLYHNYYQIHCAIRCT